IGRPDMPFMKSFNDKRKATILFIVIVMLTLFLVIGLAFVLYAESEASAARIAVEAGPIGDKYPTPEEMLGWAIGQLTYGCADGDGTIMPRDTYSNTGPDSAIRGHELARDMYGWNYDANFGGPTQWLGINNDQPFNGSGRVHTGGPTGVPIQNPFGIDDYL